MILNEQHALARRALAFQGPYILVQGRRFGRNALQRAFRDIEQTDASDRTFENETRPLR